MRFQIMNVKTFTHTLLVACRYNDRTRVHYWLLRIENCIRNEHIKCTNVRYNRERCSYR